MNINLSGIGFGAAVPHTMALNVAVGDYFFTDISTENTTNSSAVKDFCSFFGSYDQPSGVFTPEYGFVAAGVIIPIGVKVNTVNCQAGGAGLYDCLGGYGVYNESTSMFTVEVGSVLQDAINVGGGGIPGEITVTNVQVRL